MFLKNINSIVLISKKILAIVVGLLVTLYIKMRMKSKRLFCVHTQYVYIR